MVLKSIFTWFTPYQKRQFGQKLEQGDQMDQIIIVFIPVKKNVSVLLKLIAAVKVSGSSWYNIETVKRLVVRIDFVRDR